MGQLGVLIIGSASKFETTPDFMTRNNSSVTIDWDGTLNEVIVFFLTPFSMNRINKFK